MNFALKQSETKSVSLKINSRDIPESYLQNSTEENPVFDRIASEGGELMLNYIKWLGLTDTRGIMILSSFGNYYDFVDFSGIKILINLRMLNQIKHLDSFLSILSGKISENCLFVGSFRDDGVLPNHFVTKHIKLPSDKKEKIMVNPSTDRILTRQEVVSLIHKNGFRIKDLTIIGNIVFFLSEVLIRTQ